MRAFLIVGIACFLSVAHGQAKLKFEKETHVFGEIKEEGGFAEFTFNFVNTGDQPITIKHVKASCGCTTPGWTKEAVMPGDSGYVKARYNPRNRPGRFRKSLRLTTTQGSENKTLYIAGTVKPKPKSIAEELPVSAGDLRLKYQSLNMGKLTTEKTVEKDFDVYNNGDDSLQLQHHLMEVPSHIQLALQPKVLAPKTKGILRVKFDPVMKDDLGFLSDNVTIQTDTAVTLKNQFYIISTIEEFFPEMTAEELDASPKLAIADRVIDFGKVVEGELVEAEFILTNEGKKKLNFRKIKSNCSCVTYSDISSNLKKGKSESLKLLFDTNGRRGNQYKTVTLFSNDPTAPTQMVTIKGTVQKKEEGR